MSPHGDTKHLTAALSGDVADHTDPAWRVALRWARRPVARGTAVAVIGSLWLAFGVVVAVTAVLR